MVQVRHPHRKDDEHAQREQQLPAAARASPATDRAQQNERSQGPGHQTQGFAPKMPQR